MTTINLAAPSSEQLYSDAYVANGLVFTTGQMPLDADWNLVSVDFVDQVRYVFDRVTRLLNASRSSVSQLVKLTIYLANIDDVAALGPLRREFLGDHRPASVIVQTGGFGCPGMLLEVEAVAIAG